MANRPMTIEEIRADLEGEGCVVRKGHFVYSGLKHGSVYINKDIILSDPLRAQRLGDELGHRILQRDLDLDVEAVVGPAMSGIKMAHLIASFLAGFFATQNWAEEPCRVLAAYAEKDGPERFSLNRGFDLVVKGRKVIVAEDVVNEGTTAQRVVETVMAAGGTVVGVAALWNRGSAREIVLPIPGSSRSVRIPIVALIEERLEAWGEDECPLCARKEPFSSLGHAASFLEKKEPV